MRLTADLHLHSHYSRATSQDLTLFHLAKWAQIKGVHIVGTGDIAHPGWLQELREHLEPAEAGLFRLKSDLAPAVEAEVPPACRGPVRFLLAGEISNIYKRGGKTRKIHHIVFAPDLDAVARLQARLERIGNIRSDGRPILGLPSHDLLETLLEVDERCCLIPAHIWTPWFALLGSMSGYDSVEECFGDLSPHIFALETGLSSDPPMNWRVSGLDRYTLVSNSDAHSPPKLAREATLFDCELSYDAIFDALRSGDPARFRGTLEFFPEEGKYHHDGHRKCGVNWKPAQTLAHGGLCSVCGKPVTVGVYHRLETLADQPEGRVKPNARPYFSLIPLPEILGELHGVGAGSKLVGQAYDRLLTSLGPELAILLELPLEAIATAGGERLAAGIGRMRRSEVTAIAGYDGEYGLIKLFDAPAASPQLDLFAPPPPTPILHEPPPTLVPLPPSQPQSPISNHQSPLNPAQRAAVLCTDRPLIIVAGPGAGKTRTLTARIAHLVQDLGAAPASILAITFTNKAAEEMAGRLRHLLGEATAARVTIKTFHAFGAMLLHEFGDRLGLASGFAILGDDDRLALLKRVAPELGQQQLAQALAFIAAAKNHLQTPDLASVAEFTELYRGYEAALRQNQAVDFDDLILLPVRLLEEQAEVREALHSRLRWLSVDEYQDINLAQYRLLRLLTAGGANLCVIGDPDQAIYGFRGADYRYFLRFEQDYPDARRLHLDQNYRSTQIILDAATQVISRNPNRQALRIFSDFVEQVKLDVHPAPTDKAEAEFIVHQIEQMVGGTSYFSLDSARASGHEAAPRSFADFAVLYRLSAQSRALAEALERSGIPYQTVGQTPLYEFKIVREALAFLWLLHNPRSQLHLDLAAGAGRSPAFQSDLAASQPEMTAAQLVERVAAFLVASRSLSQADATRLDQLARRAAPFGHDLAAFLEATILHSETDFYDPRADRVTLMTLHASKGLEFPVVFIVGCEEGLLPYVRAGEPPDIEEERRLFYVGMTRAQKKLVLSHAHTRFLFGQRLQNPPSPFLRDIASALKDIRAMERRPEKKEPAGVQLGLF
ncbi:MAG: UvrD-helicase domain-containing protein [Caldilineales bacterium]|nr:UvrD-helicase domain-containing protein [Caldilineales bacterium]